MTLEGSSCSCRQPALSGSSGPDPKRVAVLQSNYIPWKGYFDIIHGVNVCILYDDVQYTKNDWRNRNVIKTPNGRSWLTVPAKASINARICDAGITSGPWASKHLKSLYQNYARAPFTQQFEPFLKEVYVSRTWTNLSELNHYLIREISERYLGITTRFEDSRDYSLTGTRMDRLLDLLFQAGATSYLTGPAGRAYIDPTRFAEAGIDLVFMDYSGYPEYPQVHPPFLHQVSVFDLLFHCGPEAELYIWGWRDRGGA